MTIWDDKHDAWLNDCNTRLTSEVHSPFFTQGSKWLYHLSLHCFPVLSGKLSPTLVQLLVPCSTIKFFSISSSSIVQILRQFETQAVKKCNLPKQYAGDASMFGWTHFLLQLEEDSLQTSLGDIICPFTLINVVYYCRQCIFAKIPLDT